MDEQQDLAEKLLDELKDEGYKTFQERNRDIQFNNAGCLIMFLIIVGFLMSWQVIYAILQGAPQCSFARDVITCIEIVKVNR